MGFDLTPRAGPGRPKGVPNKVNIDIREMIRNALQDAGGRQYLTEQARKNPKAFLALLGRIVPQEVAANFNLGGKVTVYLPNNGRD